MSIRWYYETKNIVDKDVRTKKIAKIIRLCRLMDGNKEYWKKLGEPYPLLIPRLY